MDYLFPYPKMGISFTEILEDSLTRKLLGHDAVHAEKISFISGVTSRLSFLLSDPTKHLPFLKIGYTALEAFLQANVTGPPLDFDSVPITIPEAYQDEYSTTLKQQLFDYLTVDGIAVYSLTPRIELFWLAKVVMSNATLAEAGFNGRRARFRINFWHQKLLSEKSDTLHAQLYTDAMVLDQQLGARLNNKSAASEEHFIEFLTERAAIRTYYGDGDKAIEDLTRAAKIRHFQFALTGALGKRTKFQDRDISQLVVLAKSRDHEPEAYSSRKSSRAEGTASRKSSHAEASHKSPLIQSKIQGSIPYHPASPMSASTAISDSDRPVSPLPNKHNHMPALLHATQPEHIHLHDDTLLESIAFRNAMNIEPHLTQTTEHSMLPPDLVHMDPSDQPMLFPMDAIILLSTASSISNTSPADGLTREETIPYATRVIEGGSSNWQVYTQALLVRSRIEGYKTRTMERGLLQLQAVVDQVIAETTDTPTTRKDSNADGDSSAPSTFLPKLKTSESASVAERLKYIHQVSPPLRWELEAELAERWTTLGGLRSALEIYERLQMHAEVALCLAATDREAEAVKLLKGLVFENTNTQDTPVLRKPLPSNAPRILSILGDILDDPSYYTLSWNASNQRYARAQRSLGRYYIKHKIPGKAAEAYSTALKITRLDHATWFALGCTQLELENWPGAVESFTRVVRLDDKDAESWSNLAVALLKLPPPPAEEYDESPTSEAIADDEEEVPEDIAAEPTVPRQLKHIYEAMRALKRAAHLKRDDARIWDNYLTVCASIPPSQGTPWGEIIQAMGRVIELRAKSKGEAAIDLNILEVLINHVTETYEYPEETHDTSSSLNADESGDGVPPTQNEEESTSTSQDQSEQKNDNPETTPPHVTTSQTQQKVQQLPFLPRALLTLIDTQITPLSTSPTLYTQLATLSLWRHRPFESLTYVEKSWRATTTNKPTIYDTESGWNEVVESTIRLIDAYRTLGDLTRERTGGLVEKNWRFKARSAGRGVLGRGKIAGWDGSEGGRRLEGGLVGLKE